MGFSSQRFASGKVVTRRLVVLAGIILAVWVLFFDSHSILKRIQWHREYDRLAAENSALQEKIDRIADDLEHASSEEVVEKIAREQYGMRKPGETVYPLELE